MCAVTAHTCFSGFTINSFPQHVKARASKEDSVAKRNRSITRAVRDKRRREGRGLGKGADYKPWLRIQDVPSIGLATRDKGWKTGRTHHLMSKLEWIFFYILEWSPIVTDIREQFPLDFEETMAIAKSLGIKHPADSKTKEPIEVTTDFIVIVGNQAGEIMHARAVKYSKDLSSRRVMEKLEIERIYWTSRNIDWGLVTERDINFALASNVEWVHFRRYTANLAPIKKILIRSIEAYIAPRMYSETLPLCHLTDECDSALALKPGSSMSVVRHLIANRRLEVDMSKLIQPEGNVALIKKPAILN